MQTTTTQKRKGKARSKVNPSKKEKSIIKEANLKDRLDTECLIDAVKPVAEVLKAKVIGQDDAVDTLICAFSRLLSGLRDPGRPLLTAMLLGPTGVGKTETAKALAQTLFGDERALTRVNCEEYTHSHELSKLLGSPPGYIGADIEPLLSQKRIDQHHRKLKERILTTLTPDRGLAEQITAGRKDQYTSVILFDEIEKAHPKVWNALLGILEDGMLTLGNNKTTDFTRSIILLTSNVGSKAIGEFLEKKPMGFLTGNEDNKAAPIMVKDLALNAAKKLFPYEFINRFDEILVYDNLEKEHLDKIFDKFLSDIHKRALLQARMPMLIKISKTAKEFIIAKGTDIRFGARPLRRAMERELVDPLSRFIASQKLIPGDLIEVELENEQLVFYRSIKYMEGIIS